VFSSGLFAFFRDTHGEPFTERDAATRWPKSYDEKYMIYSNLSFCTIFLVNRLQVYTPSDQVLKQIVRKNWKIRGTTIHKNISMIVTPKVQVHRA